MSPPIGLGVIGAGYWDPHPARTTLATPELGLAAAGVSGRRAIMAARLESAHRYHLPGPFLITDRLAARSLALPLFHEMAEEEQDLVVSELRAALRLASCSVLPTP